MKLPEFKMGITFSGKYRKEYVEPICEALLQLGYRKKDIFYDEWHEELINGTRGDEILKEIYRQHCELVVVLLSPDYKERNWPGNIEWRSVKELINEGKDDKICLLGIDSVDIDKVDGLYRHQAIPKYIDSLSPMEAANFIVRVYRHRLSSEDSSYYITGRSENRDMDIMELHRLLERLKQFLPMIYQMGNSEKLHQVSGNNNKPGLIDRMMGGVAVRPEWTEYFKGLIEKMSYYMQNYGHVEFGEKQMTAIVVYHRSEILIRFITRISNDGESAEGMVMEVWESYISERKMGICVLKLIYRNDVTTIWEYIPGDWDDRILSWR